MQKWRQVNTLPPLFSITFLLRTLTTVYQVTFYDKQGNAGTPSELISVTADEDTIMPRILSVSPQGGYSNQSISMSIKAYDNCAIEKIYIDYSLDQITWENAHTYTCTTPEKEPVCSYVMDTSELPEGEIYVRAYALDTSGNIGDKGQVLIQYIIDHTAPAAVEHLTASGEPGCICLRWDKPKDEDVAGFRLYRSVEGLNAYFCINSSIQPLFFNDRSASYDTSYCYRLTAYDFAGNESVISDTVIAQKQADDEKPVVYSIVPEAGTKDCRNGTIIRICSR